MQINDIQDLPVFDNNKTNFTIEFSGLKRNVFDDDIDIFIQKHIEIRPIEEEYLNKNMKLTIRKIFFYNKTEVENIKFTKAGKNLYICELTAERTDEIRESLQFQMIQAMIDFSEFFKQEEKYVVNKTRQEMKFTDEQLKKISSLSATAVDMDMALESLKFSDDSITDPFRNSIAGGVFETSIYKFKRGINKDDLERMIRETNYSKSKVDGRILYVELRIFINNLKETLYEDTTKELARQVILSVLEKNKLKNHVWDYLEKEEAKESELDKLLQSISSATKKIENRAMITIDSTKKNIANMLNKKL